MRSEGGVYAARSGGAMPWRRLAEAAVIILGGVAIVLGFMNPAAQVLVWIGCGLVVVGLLFVGADFVSHREDKAREEIRREYQSGAHDMTLRELFFHLSPNVVESAELERWNTVGLEVRDKLCTEQVKAWGRRVDEGQFAGVLDTRYPLQPIPAEYWMNADFSFWFLAEEYQDKPQAEPNHGVYGSYKLTDIRFNRAEALRVWPKAIEK